MQLRPTTTPDQPTATLELRHAIAIIAGVVIGAGIFKSPALVAGMAGSTAWMFAAWALGGVVSLIGALCYAELATTYPSAGGDYHFLHRAFGRNVSFLFAWSRFTVITTGSIALLGFVFGDYMQQLLPLGVHGEALYAAGSVAVLTFVNLRGVRTGARTQGWLTVVEVGGLALIVLAGLYLWLGGPAAGSMIAAPAAAPEATSGFSLSGFGMAMVFVLLTYGGWNEAAYISAELKGSKRNMVRALVWSIGIITVIYLGVNWAYWRALGLTGMASSDAIAATVLNRAFGDIGGDLIAGLIAVSALTSINATMIVGARTNFAAGRDWPALGRVGEWEAGRGGPRTAYWVQGAAALVLIVIGSAADSGFRTMVEFTAPVFWLFFMLTGLALFVLRMRDPARPRPYSVPLYPLLPAIFVLTCASMLWSSLSFVSSQSLGGFNAAWIGVAVLVVGGIVLAGMHIGSGSSRQRLQE